MDFLSSLHTDVKLLLVAGALALLAGLLSGSKKKELRYVAAFAVLMVAAGVRFKHEQDQDAAAQAGSRADTAATVSRNGSAPAGMR